GAALAGAPARAHARTRRIAQPYEIEGHPGVIGISVGIAIAPADATESSMLLKHADRALYRAKSDGRNCYRFYESEMDAVVQLRRALEVDLRKALADGEFGLHYQAVMDAPTPHPRAPPTLLRCP